VPETTLEFVKRHLDTELQAESLHQLPTDFYSRISQYNQKLRRTASSGSSEATIRLVRRQTALISGMTRQLLSIRMKKAVGNLSMQLLPEERYVVAVRDIFWRRFDSFVDAISEGKPSFIEFAHRNESMKNMVIRFTRHTNEIVGGEMRRYGPFEENDVVSIPASDAAVLVAGGDAVEVRIRQ
jgi:DNA replication factor GINS